MGTLSEPVANIIWHSGAIRKSGAVEVCAGSELLVGDRGILQDGTSQVGTSQVGTLQDGTSQDGTSQIVRQGLVASAVVLIPIGTLLYPRHKPVANSLFIIAILLSISALVLFYTQ